MARRVFYSFHYKPDVMRVSQVRNIGALEANCVFLQPWPPNFTKRGHLHQAFKRSSDFNVKWLHFALL